MSDYVMTPVRWSRYSLAWRRQVGGSSALVLPHGGAPDIPPRLCLSLGSLAAALAVLVRHSRPLPAVFGLLLPSLRLGVQSLEVPCKISKWLRARYKLRRCLTMGRREVAGGALRYICSP